MCTCGIDMATQHATPATQSRNCNAPGEKPSGRSDPACAGAAGAAASTGGRRRNTSASGNIVSRQNTPMPM